MFLKVQKYFHSIPPKTRFSLRIAILVLALISLVFVLNAINLSIIEQEETGNDFLTNWLSIKLFLARGQDPYSVEVREIVDDYAIQILQWKETVPNENTFLLPIYGFIFYLPFLFFDSFTVAYAWWITFLELALFFIGYLSYRLLKKTVRKNIWIFLLIITASLANVFAFGIIKDGELLPIILIFFLLGIWALKNGADELAGVLLAFSSVLYLQVWLPLLFIMIWSFRQGRGKLAGWFLGTVVLLGISSALLMPQWVLYFARGLLRYFQENPAQFLPNIMTAYYPGTSGRFGTIVLIIVAVMMLVEWVAASRKHFAPFYWTLTLTMVCGFVFSPKFSASYMILGIPALALILFMWKDRWGKKGEVISFLVWGAFIAYPWIIASSELLTASQKLFWLLIPGVIFFLGNLYWIRWWLIKNTDLWFEDVYTFENPDRGDG